MSESPSIHASGNDRFASVHSIDRGADTSTLYRRFLVAALLSTTTLAAVFGAFNLFWLHLNLGPVPPIHHQVHAGFQLMGFVLLFVMGVAYHAVPRFLGTALAAPDLARVSFGFAVGG